MYVYMYYLRTFINWHVKIMDILWISSATSGFHLSADDGNIAFQEQFQACVHKIQSIILAVIISWYLATDISHRPGKNNSNAVKHKGHNPHQSYLRPRTNLKDTMTFVHKTPYHYKHQVHEQKARHVRGDICRKRKRQKKTQLLLIFIAHLLQDICSIFDVPSSALPFNLS